MDVITLELYGHPFAECFTLTNDFRVSSEMRNDACLAYIQEGEQEIYSPSQRIRASHNESILMKCGNYIANFENVSHTSPFKSIVFHLDPESIKKAFRGDDLDFLRVDSSKKTDPAMKITSNSLLDSYVSSIMPYFDNKSLVNERLLAAKLQELVLILSEGGKNPIATRILGTLYSQEQLEFDKIVEANIFNNLSVAELAHLTNRSASTFKRDFKKYFNSSPAKYFRIKKLERAAIMLAKSDLSVKEIAWDCGFENADHFSTTFTNHYGKSPKVFRNN